MDEIGHRRLGDVLTTYFAASGYAKGFSDEELYSLTKAMVETGEKLEFKGIVADKHSIGGVPGTRTTLIVVPIVAAAGFLIPKSSSRAITTPDGTADDMEVLSPVTFNKKEIYTIVEKTGACIVWGGGVDIAPADDVIIQVEKPLMFESYDKIVVSIMSKKIAFGSNHVVIDIPYGKSVKVTKAEDAEIVKQKFEYLGRRFHMKVQCLIHKTEEPVGQGIGPVLETRDSLRVLEQVPERPVDLEERSLHLAGVLLDMCLEDASKEQQEHVRKTYDNGELWAKHLLRTGMAHAKMKEIIDAQGGNPDVTSTDLTPGHFSHQVTSSRKREVKHINSRNITLIAKILGAPMDKKAGVFLDKKIGDTVTDSETYCTLYSQSTYHIKEAIESIEHFPIYEFI